MSRIIKTLCMFLLFIPVAACTNGMGFKLGQLSHMQPTGSAFTQGLANGYSALAREQAGEYDWTVADYFAGKAMQAASGQVVAPEQADTWTNRAGGSPILTQMAELNDARAKLVQALDNGARDRQPADASGAQVAYDCWVEEASEPDFDPACRDRFHKLLDRLGMAPMAQAAPPPAQPLPQVYLVFFAFNRANISPVAVQVLNHLIADFQRTGSASLDVKGYTDLAGTQKYNLKLSEHRADAVTGYLTAHGITKSEIRTEWFGKANPRVPTADGVRNQENRRAEIYLSK